MPNKNISEKYFGTDGIRGRANIFPMTAETAMRVGLAVGEIFREYQTPNHKTRVVIGKDTRLSGYMLENAMVAGFTAMGMDVLLVGPVPTPAISMLCRSMRADIGVMISASHNPYYYNGIKIFNNKGQKLSDEVEQKIEDLLKAKDLYKFTSTNLIGKAKRVEGDIYRYIENAKNTLPKHINLEGLRIVVDCANGAAYKAAPLTFWELGADIIPIHDKPNGLNINDKCGSTSLASIIKKVNEVRADIGIALDGDGDRVLLIDEKGNIVDGDKVLAILAKNWQKTNKLSNDCIVGTVMANLGLERYLQKLNLKLFRTPVGDKYVAKKMIELNSNLGGEQSGHIILSDYACTGDGIITALQILCCMIQEEKTLSELTADIEFVPQILKNININNNAKPLENNKIKQIIEKSITKLGDSGRILVRASGTEPLIRVMAEGDDIQKINLLVNSICEEIKICSN